MAALLLRPESLAKQVSAATFARAMEVYLGQKVLAYTLNPSSSTEWIADGQVQGSGREAYDTSVTLEVAADGSVLFFSGSCTCPVGHDCKHSVALALKAAYKSANTFSTKKAQPTSPAERLTEQELHDLRKAQQKLQRDAKAVRDAAQADQQISQWLDLFGSPAVDASQADSSDHLVYTLSPAAIGAKKVLQLSAWLTRRLQNGTGRVRGRAHWHCGTKHRHGAGGV